MFGRQCRMWVKGDTFAMSAQCPLRPQLRTFCCLAANDVWGQKRTHVAQQNSPLTRPAKSFAGLRDD
jgi:hypothetical protein